MVTKSKLKLALAAEKGVDFTKLKQKRKYKEALRAKDRNGGATATRYAKQNEDDKDESLDEEEYQDVSEDDEEEDEQMDIDAINDSDTSESSMEFEAKIERGTKRSPKKDSKSKSSHGKSVRENDGEDGDEEEDEDDDDIPVSDLEDLDEAEKEDLIPHTKLTIYNTAALITSLNRIAIPSGKDVPFAVHQSVISSTETASAIPDVSDDLQRELAFYSQSIEAVRIGRAKLRAEGIPFSRPKDYFAEMVKEDAHMEKVKAKLVEEASAKKAAAEARKLRDLKKFGKQVQVAKLQERQKAKRETLDKIKNLKRKRQESGGDVGTNEADLFDVGVDNELAKHSQRSGSGRGQMGPRTQNNKRQKKNEKYGFGGKKRYSKSGDAASSGDLSGFNAKKMKAGSKSRVTKPSRPGKSRRKAMASR